MNGHGLTCCNRHSKRHAANQPTRQTHGQVQPTLSYTVLGTRATCLSPEPEILIPPGSLTPTRPIRTVRVRRTKNPWTRNLGTSLCLVNPLHTIICLHFADRSCVNPPLLARVYVEKTELLSRPAASYSLAVAPHSTSKGYACVCFCNTQESSRTNR